MKSIYRSAKAKSAVIALYDKQISELNIPFNQDYGKAVESRTWVKV